MVVKELEKSAGLLEAERQSLEAARERAVEAANNKGGKVLLEPVKVDCQKYLVFDDGATIRTVPA